jgi:hypothetical protein
MTLEALTTVVVEQSARHPDKPATNVLRFRPQRQDRNKAQR